MAFRQSVEDWRSYFDAAGTDIGTDYILDWMDKESGGNACNLTTSAGFGESGLLQLDSGNLAEAGTTDDRYRPQPPCSAGNSFATVDQFTSDQLSDIVNGSIDFINAKRSKADDILASVGANWSKTSADYWALVRYEHAAGQGAAQTAMQTATTSLGRPPTGWSEFSQFAISHWANVAWENGQWGEGFGGGSTKLGWLLPAVLVVGVGIGIWLYEKRVGQRIGLAP